MYFITQVIDTTFNLRTEMVKCWVGTVWNFVHLFPTQFCGFVLGM